MASIIAVPNSKALLISHDAIRRDYFPMTRDVSYKGSKWLAVPFDDPSTIILRRHGIDAPHPIDHFYDWPGRFVPMEHQRATARFFAANKRCFCFNGLGSGKTMAALWAADYLMTQGIVRRVGIVSPLSTVKTVWADTLWTHFMHRSHAVCYGTKDVRVREIRRHTDFVVLNHDGLVVLEDELLRREHGDIDLWILDESAEFRNSRTFRYDAAWNVFGPKTSKWLWTMTATPMPKLPTDIWAQARLINPALVDVYFPRFRTGTMLQVNERKWVPRPDWDKIVFPMLTPAIRIATEDCIDLPPITYETRDVPLSKEQESAYKALVTKLVAELKEGKVTAANEGVKLVKLLQVTTGLVYTEDKVAAWLNPKAKLAELMAIAEEVGRKLIVFVPFVHALEMLYKVLSKKYSVAAVSGATHATERAAIFKRFQTGDLEVLVAHPACMAHGLTLTAAYCIVWFSPVHSNNTYEQANGRIRRIGQENCQQIIHLQSSALEAAIYKKLAGQQKMQGILLDLLKQST